MEQIDKTTAMMALKQRLEVMSFESGIRETLERDSKEVHEIAHEAAQVLKSDPSQREILLPRLTQLRDMLRQFEQARIEYTRGQVGTSEEWFDLDELQARMLECDAIGKQWMEVQQYARKIGGILYRLRTRPADIQREVSRLAVLVHDVLRYRWASDVAGVWFPYPADYVDKLYLALLAVQNGHVSESEQRRVLADLAGVCNSAARAGQSRYDELQRLYGRASKWHFILVPCLDREVTEAVAAIQLPLDCPESQAATIRQNVQQAVSCLDQARELLSLIMGALPGQYYDEASGADNFGRLDSLMQQVTDLLAPLWEVHGRERALQYGPLTSYADYRRNWATEHDPAPNP